MEINLLPIMNYDGRKISINEDVPVSAGTNDNFTFTKPVSFDGYALNIGGTIELKGKAVAFVSMICDRCAESYDNVISYDIFERYKKNDDITSDDDEDFTLLEGSSVELEDVLYTGLILNLPTKSLCSDECKGLCPICGKNLNREHCNCSDEVTDPRFDILDKLL